tara:strand:- start:22 stop:261 length:240 start_codon:yes stop_codon:yes gene_type:complete
MPMPNMPLRLAMARRLFTERPLPLRQYERLRPDAYLHPAVPRQAAGPLPLQCELFEWRLYDLRREAIERDLRLVTAIII